MNSEQPQSPEPEVALLDDSEVSRWGKIAGYSLLGLFLLLVFPPFFSPWHLGSYIYWVVLMAWANGGIFWNPLGTKTSPDMERSRSPTIRQRLLFLGIALLILTPFILWVAKLWWFFPWLPWWSMAYRWVVREVILSGLMAIAILAICPQWPGSRQVLLLIALSALSHLSLMMTYAAISGGPDYLQDGVTQDCFALQFRFKIVIGICALLSFRSRKWIRSRLNRRRLSFIGVGSFLCIAFVGAWVVYRKAGEGPTVKGKRVTEWIEKASPVPDDRDPSVAALRELGNDALPYLMKALRTGEAEFYWFGFLSAPPRHEIRQRAGEILKSLRESAAPIVPEIIQWMRSYNLDSNARELGFEILGSAGVSNEDVRQTLFDVLRDKDLGYDAAHALGTLGKRDPAIVEGLTKLAKSNDKQQSYWACIALQNIGLNARQALPTLIEIAKSGDWQTRQACIQAIALIGSEATNAMPVLLHALTRGEPWEKKCAVIAVGRIGPTAKAALPVLHEMIFKEDSSYTKADIARSLWRIDTNSLQTVLAVSSSIIEQEWLKAANTDSYSYALPSAIDLLGEIGPPANSMLSHIQPIIESKAPMLRFTAAWALWRIAPAERDGAIAVLKVVTESDEYTARIAALGALWQTQLESRATLQQSIAGLLYEWAHHQALGTLPPEERVLLPVLSEILKDQQFHAVHPIAEDVQLELLGTDFERW